MQGNSVDSNTVQMPTRVTSLEDMVKGKDEKVDCIAAGKSHTLAQTSAGNVFSFGLQTYGRLGRADADPSSDQSLPPGQVEVKDDDSSATHIAAGEQIFSSKNLSWQCLALTRCHTPTSYDRPADLSHKDRLTSDKVCLL